MVQTSREIYIPSFWRRRFSVDGLISGDERRLPIGKNLGRSRVQRLQHTALDRLHVNIASGLDARVSERNAQIEEELRSFFAASVEDKLLRGVSQENAEREARAEIGSRESVRHKVWSAGWESTVDSLVRELRVTTRQLRKSPGFAATAILTLAFGIGATTAIFSIVEGVLLRPLPFADPGRLVVLGDTVPGINMGSSGHIGVYPAADFYL